MKRIIPLIVAILALVGTYFAVGLVHWQHRANREFVPVEAQILSAEVRRHSGKNKSTYSPEITYRYQYGGKEYQSSQVLPFSQQSSHAWATEIVERFGGERMEIGIERPARTATAYVDPGKPEEAVLVREYSFVPYIFVMLTMSAVAISVGLFTGAVGGGRSKMTAVPLDENKACLLLPAKSLQGALRHALAWLVGAAIVVLPVWAHWALVAGQPGGLFLLIALGVLGLLAVIAYRRWTLTRNLSDARVRVCPAPLVRGQPFTFEVEADVHSPLQITGARVKVRCIEHYKEKRGNKTSYGSRTKGEQEAAITTQGDHPAGTLFAGKGELFFPAQGLPPTTDLAIKNYPYYRWELRLEVEIAKHADYRATFPLEVH